MTPDPTAAEPGRFERGFESSDSPAVKSKAGWALRVLDRVHTGWGTGTVTRLYPAEPTCGPTCAVAYDDDGPYAGLVWAGPVTSVTRMAPAKDRS